MIRFIMKQILCFIPGVHQARCSTWRHCGVSVTNIQRGPERESRRTTPVKWCTGDVWMWKRTWWQCTLWKMYSFRWLLKNSILNTGSNTGQLKRGSYKCRDLQMYNSRHFNKPVNYFSEHRLYSVQSKLLWSRRESETNAINHELLYLPPLPWFQ